MNIKQRVLNNDLFCYIIPKIISVEIKDYKMSERKISVSQQTYETISEIIIAYTLYKDSASIDDIAKKCSMRRNVVSLASGFLIDAGVLKGGKGKEKRIITEKGERLGRALKYNQDDVKNSWADLIQDNPFFHVLLQKLSNKKVFSQNQIIGAIFQHSDTLETDDTRTGARAIIQILCVAEYITKTDKKDEYKIGTNAFDTISKKKKRCSARINSIS